MKALLTASIGGLATFLVIYWLMAYDAIGFQDGTRPSALPTATLGDAIPLLLGVKADRPASGAGGRDGEAGDVQALVDRILARPLFNADRRPASAVANGPATLPRLTAVLVSSRGKTVIFAAGADGKPIALTEGGQIGNYVIRSIDAGQATVSGPNGVQVIRPVPDRFAPAEMPPLAARPSLADLMRQTAPANGVSSPPVPAPR